MPRVKYPARIIADDGFILWLINNDKSIFLHLTHIKSSSIDAKKSHNIITEGDAQEVLKSNNIKEETLFGAFKKTDLQKNIINAVGNKIDQRIILAIALATDRPYKTYIFTTKKDEQTYKDSPHYNGVKSISIKSEKDALAIIESFWMIFKSERELSH